MNTPVPTSQPQKPGVRYTTSDWLHHCSAISSEAETERNDTLQERHEARKLRDQADHDTKWSQYTTNIQLNQR